MITIDNLRPLLAYLGYKQTNKNTEVWTRTFATSSSSISVDFGAEKIVYPSNLKIHRETTTNFSQSENFVVLECVTRLLNLGYTPRQLELEKPTPKGHGVSGGHCDIIIIQNNQGEVFALVECKTMGSSSNPDEFTKAWSTMEKDGGQLFNYFNTYRQATALCLYASDWDGGRCVYQSRIVSIQDNESYIQASKLPSYADVDAKKGGIESYFKVWRDTYGLGYSTRGLFEEGAKPFTIGQRVPCVEDLKEADGSDIQKKYHEYATIMRQHNVSGRENAFDKLLNLFLAKIVDETRNRQALKFHWAGPATDDYYSLQDRLQKMYSEGMNEFLGEQVTYIDEQQISHAFTHYLGDLDATKDAVLQYFREQKFYTNNDFAFLDVHNEVLFRQNAEILKKVVCMLQDIRLRTDKPNQFLGDLFEGFLDQGVKQNEGQFFTPLPIVRFIVSSLPLEKLHAGGAIPKVIDYACGSGHFLNEYAQQVKPLISELGVTEQDCYKEIYGIEKEYRLSKVAKVSAFMYGQDNINIIYQDALKKHERITEGSYSVLIANPPYSVKGFLETLIEEERLQYELNEYVSDISANNSIEVFFLERASQLLRSAGVAAIILPSSVLSNGNIYSRARELMLREFQIVAIAEFGSGTFGKTGTNTVTLFLRKRDKIVPAKEHYRNRVKTWFSGDFAPDGRYQDAPLLEDYCRMQDIDRSLYETLLRQAPTEELWEHGLFKSYRAKFTADAEAKRILKKKLTKKYTRESQAEELEKYILKATRELEQEKLYYYLLAKSNGQPVLIIKSPADNLGNKRFLGYEWSSRKGDEGIKYVGSVAKVEDEGLSLIKGIDSIQTPLFNPQDLGDSSRINSLVRSYFLGEVVSIPEELKSYCSTLRLSDMIDFKRADWDVAIRTVVSKSVEIESRYPIKPLREFVDTLGGLWTGKKAPFVRAKVLRNTNFTSSGTLSLENVAEIEVEVAALAKRRLQAGDIIVEKSGGSSTQAVGRVVLFDERIQEEYAYSNFTVRLRIMTDILSSKYLHLYLHDFYLKGGTFSMQNGSSGLKNLNMESYLSIPIPLPPMDIQRAIVEECAVVDAEYETSLLIIEDYREKIEGLFAGLRKLSVKRLRLSDKSVFSLAIGKRVVEQELKEGGTIPVYSANVYTPFGLIDRLLIEDFSLASVLWGIDGDWMTNIIPAGVPFYPTDHCGVLRVITGGIIKEKYLQYELERAGKQFGFSRSLRASIDRVEQLSIPVPPLQEQERIIREIEGYEAEIRKAEAVMQGAEARKSAILRKYLE
nr:N-6 DNA methylase [uncultured Porphyromonas sp.]